jgi:transcription elongation factor GreA
MTSTGRVWISAQAHQRLQRELAKLRELLSTAADDSDSDENAAAVRRARQARIQRIHELLFDAAVGEDPPDDGVAEPGMVVTVRYDDTGDSETFLLGVRGEEYADMDVYSVQSPLGAAILGARAGQRRTYSSPAGATMAVTVLKAVPHGMHTADLA